MIQTGFKATDKDGKCRGYQYLLPTKNEEGTWRPEPIPFEPYKQLPGITKSKLRALHAKFLKAMETV